MKLFSQNQKGLQGHLVQLPSQCSFTVDLLGLQSQFCICNIKSVCFQYSMKWNLYRCSVVLTKFEWAVFHNYKGNIYISMFEISIKTEFK